MKEESELITGLLAAYNEKGAGAVIEYLGDEDALAPGFMARVQPDMPNGGDWPGVDGYTKMARTWLEVWDRFVITLHDVIPAGKGGWICPVTQIASSPAGADFEAPFFYTFVFDEGRLARLGIWADESLAREDLRAG